MIQGLVAVEKAGSSVSEIAGFARIPGPASMQPDVTPAASFAAHLSAVTENAVDKLKGAESMSMQALQGEVEVREVVDAVMGAEQTLQTAIAIRDKIVSSYLEVSRMAI